ncbi:MAG: hypothetical protein JNL32_06855 [Candidatus Kapabacteria bacterium]|nr:hypothetical protein [Candidatus Kapabacteria bacterium]
MNTQPLTEELRIKGACERLGIHSAATDTLMAYMPKVVAELLKPDEAAPAKK